MSAVLPILLSWRRSDYAKYELMFRLIGKQATAEINFFYSDMSAAYFNIIKKAPTAHHEPV